MKKNEQRKMLISGGLTFLALIFALTARHAWNWLAALAMAVSTLGDAMLAGYPACFRAVKDRLVKGGIIFLLAHILYIAALIRVSGQSMAALLPLFWIPALFFAFLTAAHGYCFYFRTGSAEPKAFFAAFTGYLLIVGLHAAAAVCVCSLKSGALTLNALGAALFFLSDAILLARKYVPSDEKRTSFLVWLTYVPAQFCLILGFFLA